MINPNPGPQSAQLLVRVEIGVRVVDQVEQALDQGVGTMLLAQREKSGGVGTLVGRDGASASDADGVVATVASRHDLLEADLVAPGGVEVVLVEETLALEYLAGLRHKGHRPATLRAYHSDLSAAATALPLPLSEIGREALEGWLGEAPSASSQARRLASLRGFFTWCLARELVPRDPTWA